MPVQSVALLLRPQADGAALSGQLQHRLPDGLLYHEFRYNVVRVWELPAEEVLAGGLATLPLAPIARVAPGELPALIRTMEQRIKEEATRGQAAGLMAATLILSGLIYPKEFTMSLSSLAQALRESSTYQAILEEGRERGFTEGRAAGRAEGRTEGRTEGEHRAGIKFLMKLGTKRFGPPDSVVLARIEAMTDLERIEVLIERVLDVASWEELLAGV